MMAATPARATAIATVLNWLTEAAPWKTFGPVEDGVLDEEVVDPVPVLPVLPVFEPVLPVLVPVLLPVVLPVLLVDPVFPPEGAVALP